MRCFTAIVFDVQCETLRSELHINSGTSLLETARTVLIVDPERPNNGVDDLKITHHEIIFFNIS